MHHTNFLFLNFFFQNKVFPSELLAAGCIYFILVRDWGSQVRTHAYTDEYRYLFIFISGRETSTGSAHRATRLTTAELSLTFSSPPWEISSCVTAICQGKLRSNNLSWFLIKRSSMWGVPQLQLLAHEFVTALGVVNQVAYFL